MSDSVRWRIYEYFSLENDQVNIPLPFSDRPLAAARQARTIRTIISKRLNASILAAWHGMCKKLEEVEYDPNQS